MNITCPKCGGPTVRGDVRSGILSFGDFSVGHDGDRRTVTGAPKPKSGVHRDNRVISFACQQYGGRARHPARAARYGRHARACHARRFVCRHIRFAPACRSIEG